MKATIKIAVLYFLVVFTAGFILGAFRELLLVEAIGARNAELLEMPIMAIVCALAAKYFVQHNRSQLSLSRAFGVGLLALTMLLLFEFTVVLWLRGIPIDDYVANRDPVSGLAYIVGLLWYLLAPAFFYARKSVGDCE